MPECTANERAYLDALLLKGEPPGEKRVSVIHGARLAVLMERLPDPTFVEAHRLADALDAAAKAFYDAFLPIEETLGYEEAMELRSRWTREYQQRTE